MERVTCRRSFSRKASSAVERVQRGDTACRADFLFGCLDEHGFIARQVIRKQTGKRLEEISKADAWLLCATPPVSVPDEVSVSFNLAKVGPLR